MTIRAPQTSEEFEMYFDLRWRILRQAWGKERGSETDQLEDIATHAAAFLNNRIIGVARLNKLDDVTGQIRFMAVDQSWQNKKVGVSLLMYLEEQAIKQGMQMIMLQARENAVKFYVNNGYVNTGRSFLLWDSIQHYKMEKKL